MARGVKGSGRKRTVSSGSTEHIEVIRGPLIKQIDELKLMIQDKDNERRAALDEMRRARNSEKDAMAERDKVLSENRDLRTELYFSHQELARFRGYIEGLEDSKPPRMVPEQREYPLAKFSDGSRSFGSESCRYTSQPKAWYKRG